MEKLIAVLSNTLPECLGGFVTTYGKHAGLTAWVVGAILCAVILPMRILAQTSQTDNGNTLRVSTQLVLLEASVSRKKTGEPIRNLGVEDFLLEEDGVRQRLTYLSRDRIPLSVVFLFDLTDSVRPVLKTLAGGTRQVLEHLKPEDEVAVMGFSSRTILFQDFTTDRSLAAAAVAKASDMKTQDGTFIHEDMYEAIDEAFQSTVPGSRRVLVWLTDGSANLQNRFTQKTIGQHSPEQLHSRQEATDKLVRSGVVASALIERSAAGDAMIAFGYLGGAHMGDVTRYADLTGGPVLKSSKPDVAAKLGELIDELRLRETLGYKPMSMKPAGTYCKLKLQLSPAFFAKHPEIKGNEVVIRTRQGFYR
jgi:VWFA-related protein